MEAEHCCAWCSCVFFEVESANLMGGMITCLLSIMQFTSLSRDQQVGKKKEHVHVHIHKEIDLRCKKDFFQQKY